MSRYIYNFTEHRLGKPVVSIETYEKMMTQLPQCIESITKCNEKNNSFTCKWAQTTCNNNMLGPYAATGIIYIYIYISLCMCVYVHMYACICVNDRA